MVPQAIWANPGEFRGHVGALGPGAGGLPTPALPDTDSRREQMPDAKAWWELVYVHCGAGEGWAGAGGAVQLGAVSAAAGRRQWLGVAGDSSG